MTLDFSRPCKPTDNAFIESFNGHLRDECLNANWFLCLDEARCKIETWGRDYNWARPHTALECMTPAEFASSAGLNPADDVRVPASRPVELLEGRLNYDSTLALAG